MHTSSNGKTLSYFITNYMLTPNFSSTLQPVPTTNSGCKWNTRYLTTTSVGKKEKTEKINKIWPPTSWNTKSAKMFIRSKQPILPILSAAQQWRRQPLAPVKRHENMPPSQEALRRKVNWNVSRFLFVSWDVFPNNRSDYLVKKI